MANVSVSPHVVQRVEIYWNILASWNARMNLTSYALEAPSDDAVDRLLVEPLAAVRHVPAGTRTLVDLGSGGGSPAIPLAIGAGLALTMVEARQKKAFFLREAARILGLSDASVEMSRFETLAEPGDRRYDLLSLRAVRLDAAAFSAIQTLVKPGGTVFLFTKQHQFSAGSFAPPLTWCQTVPLLPEAGSELVVCRNGQECFT